MFTAATKNFGVWKEWRKANIISHYLASIQFVVALSIVAFIIFLTFIVVVKIRQEFFLVESAPIHLFKNKAKNSQFFLTERPSALSIFIKKDKNNLLNVHFDSGRSFVIPQESKEFVAYLEQRKRSIIYMAMVLRMNSEQNSRLKIWSEEKITFEDIRLIMKIFSQYGFDSFDLGVEQ
jgi:hypothetical protein